MPLKVTWKKGMRLSTDVFNAMDASLDENIRLSNLIATGGNFGLIHTDKPFELSVNVSNTILEIVSLSCRGVTKSGRIVDIDFDSAYSDTFDTRITLPSSNGDEAFLLIVRFHDKQWREVNEMYSEPLYNFALIGENSPIDRDSLPIGRIVNQYGWRLDETEFVPPCLFTGAHPRFEEQVIRAKSIMKAISDKCLKAQDCVARNLIGSIWQSAADNYILIDKSSNSLSPGRLFGSLQQVIASFVIGCSNEKYVSLEHADPFVAYYQKTLDERNLYRDIQEGLKLCDEISIKMDAVCAMNERIDVPSVPGNKKKDKEQTTEESGRRSRRFIIEV